MIRRIHSSLILHLLYCIFYIIVSECEQTFYFIYFVNLTFCKPDVLKPDVLKPDVLWVYHMQSRAEGGGESRAANSDRGSFSAWGGLGKLDRGLDRGEPFFPDSNSDSDRDETFQIFRKLGRVHVEFFCLLDSQPCLKLSSNFLGLSL